jgi:hypothetical protein
VKGAYDEIGLAAVGYGIALLVSGPGAYGLCCLYRRRARGEVSEKAASPRSPR